jgi:hypothetical protein
MFPVKYALISYIFYERNYVFKGLIVEKLLKTAAERKHLNRPYKGFDDNSR